MDKQQLKPCPFCGHDTPEFERLGTPRQSCIVVCGNCGCRHESSDEGEHNGASWNDRAPSPGVDAAERKILYTVKVSGAFQTFSRTVHSLSLVEGEYDLYAGAYREPHPPSRDCMCAACRPSFDNGADDPARRYDITRGGANG